MISRSAPQTPSARVRTSTAPSESGGSGMSSSRAELAPGQTVIARIASRFPSNYTISHETACILNAGDANAHVAITIFFANRNPVGPYCVMVAARRTLHLRFNDLSDPQRIPRDEDGLPATPRP
jgi:hypothetical protein